MQMKKEIEKLYYKEEQFNHLQVIIETLLGVDVTTTRSRLRHVVNSKMIYANILYECGYGCSVIARSLKMNHASMLHYFKVFDGYQKSDSMFRNNYERIKSEFNKEYDPVYYLSENELKKEAISLRIEKETLTSELELIKEKLSLIQTKRNRFGKIYDTIEQRTKSGSEDRILLKINQLFNGVYDHRD